jgi:hypothetical protein
MVRINVDLYRSKMIIVDNPRTTLEFRYYLLMLAKNNFEPSEQQISL